MQMSKGIVDIHIHPLISFITEIDLLVELRKANVNVGVLLALDVDPLDVDQPEIKNMVHRHLSHLHVWDAPYVLEQIKYFLQVAQTSNKLVYSLVRRYPEKFLGFGSINLSKSDTYIEEKIAEIDKLDLTGIKFIPTLQFFNPAKASKKLEKVMEYCERKEKIVMFHTGCDPLVWEYPELSEYANPKYLESIIRNFEEVPLILAHMGCYSTRSPGIWLDEALRLGKTYENVWFDIAAVPYVVTRERFVDKIRRTVGLDRVLFGSDYPVVDGVSIGSSVVEVRNSSHLTEQEKAKVLGLNAIELLRLRPPSF